MLYIYKASAGSGKTHLLTGFFLQLLFNKPQQPTESERPLLFNEILAVTFTNKATAEMKERIIQELHLLSTHPEKSDFIDKIRTTDATTLASIQHRAHSILNALLNDYSGLHVSTIDSFFQQVLRSFAHELNLQGNYEIELDSDAVLDKAVSQFIVGLDPKREPEIFNWVKEFAANRLSEGAAWNIHDDLLKLAKLLTSEDYRKHSRSVAQLTSNREGMRRYIFRMKNIQSSWRSSLIEVGRQGVAILNAHHLAVADFKGGNNNSMGCFAQWASGSTADPTATLKKWACDTSEWYGKTSNAKGKLPADQEERLRELMQQGVDLLIGDERVRYESARAITRNIYQLGLLARIEQEANRYCEEQGIQLLSNTTQLLSALIQGEETPFIYEKTGTRIQSFMIDEFQDTSTLQWENFQPLLKNSLDNGNENLIVGDVKQSIYRWRGSDWELLHSKIKYFSKENQREDEHHNQLLFNFRSDRKIISFNNDFFRFSATKINECLTDGSMQKVADIYADVRQEIHSSREKKIKDGIIHYEEVENLEGEKGDDAILRRLPEVVIALQQKGFKARDILILGRSNSDCKSFAETLLNYGKAHPECPYTFDIITDEALSLVNRSVIQAIVAMLHAIHEPKSEIRYALANCCYLHACGMTMAEAIACHFQRGPKDLQMPDILRYSNQPLFEMVEALVALLPCQQNDGVFLQAFRDLVLDHVGRNGTDLGGFLQWWEEKGGSQSISTPADQNAIRIMTIHQSKGLGEAAVIVPKANWAIDINTSHDETLWLSPKQEEFLPEGVGDDFVLPIRLDKMLPSTIFKEDFNKERIRVVTDNLNTAYVAFTRAKNAMVIMSPMPSKKINSTIPKLDDLLKSFMADEERTNDDISIADYQSDILQPAESKQNEGISQTAAFTLPEEPAVSPARPQIKRSIDIPTESEARGTTIHNALSAVRYADDYEMPISQLFLSGRAELKGITLDELLSTVGQLIRDPRVASWFARDNRIFTEQNIVTHTTHTQRPDRIIITPAGEAVIIDYKTGKTRSDKYELQVRHYMRLMGEMGFARVSGYLWYLDQDSIEQVTG